jgi:hypothetical protein
MILLRLLIFLLICYIVITALKSIVTPRGTRSADRNKKFTEESEDMVLDPQCQSYIPKVSAVAESGKFFCSRECAQRYLSG